MYVIGRPINGITINGLEYALDDEGSLMEFQDEEQAKKFLRDRGIPSEEVERMLDDGELVIKSLPRIPRGLPRG